MSHEQQQNSKPTSDHKPVIESAQAVVSISESQPANSVADKKATYTEKTNRIQAWSQFIQSITPFIWVAVILIVIIPLLGRGFIAGSLLKSPEPHVQTSHVVTIDRTLLNQNEVDRAISSAIGTARTQAESFASEQLDEWVDELMNRVDASFLDWYFNYFNQKKLEFSTPFIWLSSAVVRWIDTKNPSPGQKVAENLTQEFQTEFAKRVLRPKIAQLELERITRDTINLYVSELGNNLSTIQSNYKIPQGQWERYLGDIAITISDTEGNISNLSLKVLVGGSTYLLAKAMIPAVTKIGSKVAVSFAGKATAKMAAKTGGAVATKIGAEFLDPIVAVGIIIWDLWDYQNTVKVSRPILREAIQDYLKEVKASLLDNPEDGIMAAIYQLESGILKSVRSASHPS
jgi:hypothetical protein